MQENKKTILIVDDTETNIDILLEYLDDEYDVVVALDGESGLNIVSQEKIDLILLDIVMPGIDGYEVCKILKSNDETKNIPVIFITSSTDNEAIVKAYDVGGIDYISKPFKSRELLARVKNQLELKSLIDTLEEKVEEQVSKILNIQEQMLQTSRMAQMGEMISMIAHQWRQPLSAISAVTLGIETKVKIGVYNTNNEKSLQACQDKILESSCKINELVQGLSSTIDDFRNFFKPNKDIAITSVNLPITKALQIIETSLLSDNIKIVQELTSSKNIEMYDSEFMQVVLNIFQNAQDNFREKNVQNAYISIFSKDTKTGIEVSFTDNGGGISEDIIEKIFDPYFSTKIEKTGTGLGLSMSKIIVNKHHKGNMDVANTKDGVCFTVALKDKIHEKLKF